MLSKRLEKRLNKKIRISLGSSAYNSDIVQREISVRNLFGNLKKPKYKGKYSPKKKDGQYFIFASFKHKATTRNAHNVHMYYGATIDIDDSNITPSHIHKKLGKYLYCLYSTFSHKVKGNRYRVVLPYETPLTPNDHVEMVLYLMDKLGFDDVDLSSKTLSLPMFLPATHHLNKDDFVYKVNSGFLLDFHKSHIQDKIPEIRFKKYERDNAVEELNLSHEVEDGKRNSTISRVAGKFIQQGVSKADLYNMVWAFNLSKVNPPLEEREVKTIVKSMIKTHSRNNNDLAWGFDEIMRRIESTDDLKQDFTHICRMIAHGRLHKKFSVPELEMLINELRAKTKVTKSTINQELTRCSYEIQGKDEELLEESIKDQSESLKKKFLNWVYIGTDDKLYNLDTGQYLKRDSFNAMFSTPDLKTNLFAILTKHNIIEKVFRTEFDPQEEAIYTKNKVKYVNTYIAPDLEPIKGDVSPLIRHFKYLIEDKTERDIILDFIAFLCQRPGEKIRWMLVIKGNKGVGKSLIAETILANILGMHNVGKVENKLIKSDFNAWQLDKQLIVFEELNVGQTYKEKKAFTESLKSFITDNMMKAHKKGLDPYDVINRTCCIGFTNVEEPIIVEPGERRFCMIKTYVHPKPNSYYRKFLDWCERNQEQIYHYFMTRDVSGFKYITAPDTPYTQELKLQSMAWPADVIYGMMNEDKELQSDFGALTFSHITAMIKARSSGKYRILCDEVSTRGSSAAKLLTNALSEVGFRKYSTARKKDNRLTVNGKREHVWILPGADNFKKAMSVTESRLAKQLATIKLEVQDEWNEEEDEF